jgi:hypothetical protein
MYTRRRQIWATAIVIVSALLLLELAEAYPSWVVIGPVCLGVAGVALLIDQVCWAPARRWGFLAGLLMVALSAGTVLQDAELVVDEWAVWPFVAGALALGIPLEAYAAHSRHHDARRVAHRPQTSQSTGAKTP